MLFVYSGSDPDHEKELVQMFRAKHVDGVIIQPVMSDSLGTIKPLQQARIPVVFLQHGCPGVPCVVLTDVQGGQLATQHLLDLGHRRIGFIKGHIPSTEKRITGYYQALQAARIELNPALVIESEVNQNAGYQAMQQLLALAEPPTAVVSHNDVLAVGAIEQDEEYETCVVEVPVELVRLNRPPSGPIGSPSDKGKHLILSI
jgi:LacI family transcriptional regulator